LTSWVIHQSTQPAGAGGATAAAEAGVPDRIFIKAWAMEVGDSQGWICQGLCGKMVVSF